MEKIPYQVYFTEKRLNELKVLGKTLDMPVSVLVRMGAGLIIQKYKKQLIEASVNDKN